MKLKTVGDLTNYLEANQCSPETLAKRTKMSNMTLRRLLKRPQNTLLPEKYRLQLEHHLGKPRPSKNFGISTNQLLSGGAAADFAPFLSELEQTGRRYSNVANLETEVQKKVKADKANIGRALLTQIQTLAKAVSSPKLSKRQKAIAVGALLYFVNPFDLIPDAIPVVGYLDDFAVLSLVVGMLASPRASKS